ncbi:protein POLLENLESS 3-LIKE 2-like [Hevea brasiliensis]|uniref:protein POLLENLESS 3-LIKE 2-like n=1 Tax=Hevea brasiliensis TaxID=3981 RepID=UPI0025E4C6DC|nr:protein POLLENLESS 3-LIKE 2-like [Hevea brasiliensis]
MLHRKLKNIEEGIAFGGKRTKIARSQGKKIQITIEQERSRILGNLAQAYLRHHDYGLVNDITESSVLGADKNKRCNLAIACAYEQNSEAKSTLGQSKSVLTPIGEDKLKEVVTSLKEVAGAFRSMDSEGGRDGRNKEPVLSDKHIRGSDCGSHSENQGNFACSLSSQQNGVDNYWRNCIIKLQKTNR